MKNKIISILLLLIILFPLRVSANNKVYIVKIDSEITGATVSYVEDAVQKAKTNNIDTLLFEIDTYGGQVVAAEKIKNIIINSGLNTIAYVNNKAESAGVLITIACEKIYMAPTATMGSAETIPKTEKNMSFWRSVLRDTAKLRGRNSQLIEAMADSDINIPGIAAKGKLLNLIASEALDLGISDGTVRNYKDILNSENLKNYNFENVDKSLLTKLVQFISNNYISTLLIILGMVFLVVEIFTPGFGVGGTISLISFGLFFMGNIISGNSNLYSLFVFLLGILLLLIEVIVPGFGLPGIAGTILTIIGLVISMQTLELALKSIAIAIILSIIVAVILIKKGANSKFAKRMTLFASTSSEKGFISVDSADVKVGDKGISLTYLRPIGKAKINEKIYEVFSENGLIAKDKKIVVSKVDKSKIYVEEESYV